MPDSLPPNAAPVSPPAPARNFLAAAAGDLVMFAFAALLVYASFAADKPEPYLFPRILSALLLALALARLAALFTKAADLPDGAAVFGQLKSALPAAALMIVYVLTAEALGFYAAAALAYFCMTLLGASRLPPLPGAAPDWRRRAGIAALAALGMSAALYVLFSLLLQVQSPRGILF